MKESVNRNKISFYVIMVALTIMIPFLSAEILLRILGTYETYSEQIGAGYRSYYNQEPTTP